MSDKTGISWSEATWNDVTGCDKISPGCKNCYAKRDWARLAKMPNSVYYGREFEDVATHAERLSQPLRWTRPRMIFVNSMSDLFHKDVPFEYIAATFGVMALASRHTFQSLTKRADVMLAFFQWLDEQSADEGPLRFCLRQARSAGAFEGVKVPKEVITGTLSDEALAKIASWPLDNVWLGVSAESQLYADERVPLLLRCPAKVHWVSAEPLLGALDLTFAFGMYVDRFGNWRSGKGLDWVVVGGESGEKARPMRESWVLSLLEQCEKHRVAFFFKQWGEWQPSHMGNPGCIGTWGETAFKEQDDASAGAQDRMVRAGSNAEGWDLLQGKRYANFPVSTK